MTEPNYPQSVVTSTSDAGLFAAQEVTDDQLRATVYFAVGVSSESKDEAYILSVAGSIHGAEIITPADNSGYSIGTIQTDLGQHYQPQLRRGENIPADLVEAYQIWAAVNHGGWVLNQDSKAQTIGDLGRNGNTIRADHGRPLDSEVQSHLETFLSSNEGISWIHARDVVQVDKLVNKSIIPLKASELYQHSTADDKVKLAAMVSKAYNQNEGRSQAVIDDISHNRYHSISDVSTAIGNLAPRRSHGRQNYFESGRDDALSGAETFNALRNSSQTNSMHEPWLAVVANPLINPSQLRADPQQPHLADQYATVRGAFVDPAQGRAFVGALQSGGSHNYGDPASSNSRGFYVEGADFLQWDKNGKGRAFVGGQWSEFSRNELALARNSDHTLDVNIHRNGETRSLLHVTHPTGHSHRLVHGGHEAGALHQGMHGESVQNLQAQLGELGYLDSTVAPDGKFGSATATAVRSFQHDHHLSEVGRAGPATQQAIQTSLLPLGQHDSARLSAAPSMYSFSANGGVEDPRNMLSRDHALYSKLQQRIPDASEERLLQFTAACHSSRITADSLSTIHLDETNMKISFHGTNFLSTPATVDLTTPPPHPQQAMQETQQNNQQQTQILGQATQVSQQAPQGPGLDISSR